MRASIRFPVFAAVAALVFTCSGTPPLSQAMDLKIGLKTEPNSVDPHFYAFSPNIMVSLYTFDRLINQDENMKLKPGLAVSWKPVDDLTWEFKLRKDVKWHDGWQFTSQGLNVNNNIWGEISGGDPPGGVLQCIGDVFQKNAFATC